MLAAISLLLVYLIHFPIFPGATFLEYDMADVPILIATFLFGPGWGLMLTGVVSLLQWLLISPASGWVGFVMHFIASGSYVLIAGFIYQYNRTRKTAIISLICGSLAMIAMMIPLNLIFTVYFLGAPKQVVIDMLLPIIVPFNAIKAFGNGLITFALYKAVGKVLRIERAPKKLGNNSVTE
jgi:riboflavin transporter FmnP